MQQPTPTDDQQKLARGPRIAVIAAVLVVIVLLTGAGARFLTTSDEAEPPDGVQYLDPPSNLQDFALLGTDGNQVHLSDFRGAPVLLFFGYTHCPDICPTTLGEFRAIKEALGPGGEQVQFVFVSVDGSRDTPDVVDAFVARFDESFIGLTGPEEDVRAFASDYFLYFTQADGGGSSAGYLVDHTSYSYLIGPDGRLRAIYPFDTAITTISSDLEALPAT